MHLITEALVGMGYSRSEIEDSLAQAKYDDVFATYLLLGRKNTDVSLFMTRKPKEILESLARFPLTTPLFALKA